MNVNVTLQTLTSNYHNQSSSVYIAELKQKILKYSTTTADSQVSNIDFRVQEMIESTNMYLNGLKEAELARIRSVGSWVNSSTVTLKFQEYLQSGNQSYYSDLLTPSFIRTGNF